MTDALPNTEPPLPNPTYFGRERRWRKSEIVNYERALAGLSPLDPDPDDESWLTAAQVRERFGVSDMWIWRRTAATTRNNENAAT